MCMYVYKICTCMCIRYMLIHVIPHVDNKPLKKVLHIQIGSQYLPQYSISTTCLILLWKPGYSVFHLCWNNDCDIFAHWLMGLVIGWGSSLKSAKMTFINDTSMNRPPGMPPSCYVYWFILLQDILTIYVYMHCMCSVHVHVSHHT